MAVGDVVNGFLTGSVTTSFQPAAGVECVITNVLGKGNDLRIRLTDGVTIGGGDVNNSPNNYITPNGYKMGITNTNYFTGYSNVDNGCYTGFQIK